MSSDIGISSAQELGQFSGLITKQFLGTERPWLNLYGNRVRPVAPFGSASSKPFDDPAQIHRCLPDELLFEVFCRMGPSSLGRSACVCRKWRYTIRNPILWRSVCLKAWQLSGALENYKIVQSTYDGSWKKMWIHRPRVRHEGLYVSRNTYIRTGVAEWKVTNPVHLVCYFRYLRFFQSGRFLYKISSQKVKEVAKFMNRPSKADSVYKGHYTICGEQIVAVFLYQSSHNTLHRMRLRIRGTTIGTNNRLDIITLSTTDMCESEIGDGDGEGDILDVADVWQEGETPATSHRRGLSTFVFVPFDEVETSVLNLPVETMDYFVPG